MTRLSVIAVAVVVIGIAAVGPLHTQQLRPPLDVDPNRAHITLYPHGAPNLKFYARKDLQGSPAIEVNERGAFVGSTLVCSWPGGQYNPQNEENMVLGYSTNPAVGSPTYTPCPDGFPVISTWGDHGLGGATLMIEVFTRTGTLVEVRFRRQSLYFDLNALPGDPSDIAEVPDSMFLTGPAASSFGVKMKGFPGWNWEISGVEVDRMKAQAATRLRRQPAFARFLRDLQACLASSQTPGCLVRFVQDTIPDSKRDRVTAKQFVDSLWQQVDSSDGRQWIDLEECFRSEDLDASDTAARFTTGDGWHCNLEFTKAGWKLTDFVLGE
jgi:hypothetical protein